MKIGLILPYFGKFPNYFELYLKSASYNSNIEWIIFTDDKTNYNYPKNFNVYYMNFSDLKNLFQSKFDFKIALETPQKLCDFKPAFGYLFENYISKYDFWGYCDPDIIWGNLNKFITQNMLQKYEKIFLLGHLTLMRNNYQNNRRFLLKINKEERYKKVFSSPIGFCFDERSYKSINTIFNINNIDIYKEEKIADIEPYHKNMRLVLYDYEHEKYQLEPIKKQLFTWEEGNIYRYYLHNKELIKEEFMYIHLQKRNMKFNSNLIENNALLIKSNVFCNLNEPITVENFNKIYTYNFFNNQFLRIKWKSLKHKIKYRKYFYGRERIN